MKKFIKTLCASLCLAVCLVGCGPNTDAYEQAANDLINVKTEIDNQIKEGSVFEDEAAQDEYEALCEDMQKWGEETQANAVEIASSQENVDSETKKLEDMIKRANELKGKLH